MAQMIPDDDRGALPRLSLGLAESNALSARLTSAASLLSDHILHFGISQAEAPSVDALVTLMDGQLRSLRLSLEREADD